MSDPITYLYLCYILFQHHNFISAVLQGILPKGALWFWYLKQSSMEKCLCVCVCEFVCVKCHVCVCVCSSCIQLFVILWTVTSQAPLSIEFSRQEYWNRLLFPSPGDLPDLGIEAGSPALQADDFIREAQFTCESESEATQSCPTLGNPMVYSLPGSSIHRIFQTRVLEWSAIAFSRGSSQPRDQTRVSHIAGRSFTI